MVSRGHPSLDSLVKTLYIYLRYLKYAKMFALKKIIRRRRRFLCTLELTVSLDTSHYLFKPNAGIGRCTSSKKNQWRPGYFLLMLNLAKLPTRCLLILDKPFPTTSAVLRSRIRIVLPDQDPRIQPTRYRTGCTYYLNFKYRFERTR